MKLSLYTAPTLDPITVAEMETHLGISVGTISTDSTPYSCISAASYPIDYELMTIDVAPATAWAVGDIITGQTSSKTCIIVTGLTTKTFIVKSRSGSFILGEIVGVTGTAAKLADQGAAFPAFATTYNGGYMVLGTPIDVLGHTTTVYFRPTNNGAGGTVDVKIQESDALAGPYTDWAGGAFTQVTESNDTVIQEISYAGVKKYIRVVAKTLVAACEFGADVMVWEPNISEDDMLSEIISVATNSVENDTGKKIMLQTWDYCPKSWPCGDRIKIPFGNLVSISAFIYKDSAGAETTLTENTDYLVEINGEQCGFVVLPYQGSWPSGELYPSNPITIRFVCGYATQAAVPKRIKAAIKHMCTNLYMNRGDDVIGQVVSRDVTYKHLVNACGRLFDCDFDF